MSAIGTTPKSKEIIDMIIEENIFFKMELDIARFAFAYVIKKRLDITNTTYRATNVETKWNYASVDPLKEMSTLVSVLHPEEHDVEKYVERLINMGIEEIGKKIYASKLYSVVDLVRETISD